MSDIVRRWRVLWIGEAACVLLAFSILLLFYFFPDFGEYVRGHGWLVLLIALLLSPMLWLEFGITWALAGRPSERSIRIGGAMVLPVLAIAVVVLMRLNPHALDQLAQPVGWVWIVSIGMRFLHLFAVMQSAKSD